MPRYTVPSMDNETAEKVATTLQARLNSLIDLQLTLKHVHWNVVGPHFIAVHEMVDGWVDEVREMVDDVAERIATLGVEPVGTPGYVTKHRTWDDYALGRADALEHLAALDVVYQGVLADHRAAIAEFDDLDLVSQDMLIAQADKLALHLWFMRAHLQNGDGEMAHGGATSELEAARKTRGA